MLLTNAEAVAQVAWDWLLAGRHAEDVADLIRTGHEALHFTPADAAAVRAEILR